MLQGHCFVWRVDYFVGLDAVNSEQQGLTAGWNSMVSARVPSGSNRLYCHLPSRPILGPLVRSGMRSPEQRTSATFFMSCTPREKWSMAPSCSAVTVDGIPLVSG